MVDCDADVTPNQPWPQDGTANVVLGDTCNMTGQRILPLKHFPPGQRITIRRAEYPEGLVVMPIGGPSPPTPATLPCRISDMNTIILLEQSWPQGYVGWFTE